MMPETVREAEEMLAVVEQREKGQIDLVRLRKAARTDPPSWSWRWNMDMAAAETWQGILKGPFP